MSNAPPLSSAARTRDSDAVVADAESRAAAFKFLSGLAQELSKGTVNLPCFPDIVPRIRKALSDPDNTTEKTVQVVGTEPRLAARLLQTANSAVFNPSGKPFTDLRAAVTRLGHQLVQSATLSFAVRQMKADRSLRAVAAPLDRLWEKSLAVASICQVVARRTRVRPEEAFLTGLLHGIGRLYIMVRAAESRANGSTYDDFVDLVADWHPSIGKAVLENWGFLEEMAEAVAHQGDHEGRPRHDPDLTDILIVSVLLADVLGDGKTSEVGDLLELPAFVTLGLRKKECALILKHAYHQLGSLHEVLGR